MVVHGRVMVVHGRVTAQPDRRTVAVARTRPTSRRRRPTVGCLRLMAGRWPTPSLRVAVALQPPLASRSAVAMAAVVPQARATNRRRRLTGACPTRVAPRLRPRLRNLPAATTVGLRRRPRPRNRLAVAMVGRQRHRRPL